MSDAERRARSRERGLFTLFEVMMATIILAMAATATAYWVETVSGLSGDAGDQTKGLSVIQVVESAMRPLAFREPGTTTIGPEPGETLADFDDIDDFHGLVSSPPFDPDLAPNTELSGWKVSITVTEVGASDLEESGGSDLRQIHVVVSDETRVVSESWWLRARSTYE